MKSIREHLKPETTNIKSERSFILSEIIDQLNAERQGTKYKPVIPKVIAIKTSHLKLNDLRDFHKQCLTYKKENKGDYGKCFYGCLNPKNIK